MRQVDSNLFENMVTIDMHLETRDSLIVEDFHEVKSRTLSYYHNYMASFYQLVRTIKP